MATKETSESEKPAKRKVVKRYSIFTMLIALLVALVVIPLVSFAIKVINDSKNNLESTLRERQVKTASATASYIQSIVQQPESKLKTLVASFEIYSSDQEVLKKYNDLVEHGILDLISSKEMPLVEYLDKDGNRLTSYYFNQKNEDPPPFPLLTDADVATLSPILMRAGKEAMTTNGIFSSKVFTMSMKFSTSSLTSSIGNVVVVSTPVKVVAMPLRQQGSPVAAIVVLANLSKLQEAVNAWGKEFNLFISDGDGKLICQTVQKPLENKSDKGMTFFEDNADLSSNPLVKWALSRFKERPPTNLATENTTIREENGEEILVTCSQISEQGPLLFSYVPKSQFFEAIYSLEKTSTLWVIFSIVAALFFGVFTARQITKPITILTEQSRKLASGDWSAKADVKTRNEVGELAEAFNFMASEIQKYIEEVEEKAEENKHLFMSSIEAIVQAIDAKDPYTKGHSARVSGFSLAVAKEYGFDEESIRVVRISSLLHDVGKIGIEDRILRKPGALTNEEFEIMKTHPVIGADIMGSIPQMKLMIPGIKHHHERWSGGGYPDGLKGSQIPILARIVGIADAFDAMTTDRPYQKAMTFEVAANRIKELTPKVYDPIVTEAFLKAFRSGVFEKILKMTEVKR